MRRRSRCEALMAVPPGPAQPGSAPVFGRYAGVQGVQRGKSSAEPCFHRRFDTLGASTLGASTLGASTLGA